MKAVRNVYKELLDAIARDDAEQFEALLWEKGASSTWHQEDPTRSPIRHAVDRYAQNIVSKVASTPIGPDAPSSPLIDQKKKLHMANSHGNTPLMSSCASGRPELVRTILSIGPNVNHRNKKGESALHLAARAAQPRLAEALLLAGAKMDALTLKGLSVMESDVSTTMLAQAALVAYGADASKAGWKVRGFTAREAAIYAGLEDRIMTLLRGEPSACPRDSLESLAAFCDRQDSPQPTIKAMLQSEMALQAIDMAIQSAPRGVPPKNSRNVSP